GSPNLDAVAVAREPEPVTAKTSSPGSRTAESRAMTPVLDSTAAGALADGAAAEFTPFVARVRVLDQSGASVPGAEVTYAETPGLALPGRPRPAPVAVVPRVFATDATGCVAIAIPHATFCIEAHKPGVGTSGRIHAHAGLAARLADDWVLMLRPLSVVRGLV